MTNGIVTSEERGGESSASDEKHFRIDKGLKDLAGRTISSGFVTGAAQAAKFVLTIASAMLLARLLDPKDFGLVGMVTTLTGFLAMFSEAGLSTATVQAEQLNHRQASNLFWINVVLSGAMGLVTAILAPGVAWFYHDERLVRVTLFLALSFPLTGLALQHRALLNRQMRFAALAKIDVGSLLISIFIGCSLAIFGFGYWSLVGMQLAAAAAACVLAWGESSWRPAWLKRKSQTWSLVSFGLDLTGSSFAHRIARSCDTLLLGRFWGPASVGLYSRSMALLMNPIEQFLAPIGSVMLPVLSRLQGNPERYRRAFLKTYDAIGFVSFPVMALCLATAHPLVLVLLGPKWTGAVGLFAGFTVAALYMPLAVSAMWLFTSQGRSRDMFKTTVLLAILTVLAFVAGLPYGALGLVLCFSISGLIIRLPLLYYMAGRHGPVRTSDLWKTFVRHLPVWGAVYGAATLGETLTRKATPLEQLFLCVPMGMAAGALTVYALEHQRKTARYLFGTIRRVLIGEGSQDAAKVNGSSQKSVLGRVKAWFRLKNEEGKYVRLRAFWQWARNVYDYHPPERFLNWLLVQTNRALGFWQPIQLPASVLHTRFHICVEHFPQGRRVVKLPHGQNRFSCNLIQSLKDPEASARYLHVLKTFKQDPCFENHSVTVTEVRANGRYSSEYVEGINLAQMREELSNCNGSAKELFPDLAKAVHQLLQNLNLHYQKHGRLIGDWPLHNLVFSPSRKAIINVDAEGFFTYDHGSGEAHLPFIEANLLNLLELLKLMDSADPNDAEILNVFKALDEVRRSGKQYSGASSVVGYHSLELKGKKFRGQRDCQERLAQIPFDFKGKVVADLGSNVGGMLHSLAKTIRKGYGFDYNPNCINAAQLISKLNESPNLEFFTFDLDAQPLGLLKCFMRGQKVDICFLLSMCRWLKRWEEVVFEASQIAEAMLFESNGTARQQEEQAALLRKYYKKVMLLNERSPDDFTLGDRKLYLCTRGRPEDV